MEFKTWIKYRLESWAETFNNDYPDYLEDEIKEEEETYKYIHTLIYKYSNDKCSKEDYENIYFHLWQSISD